MLRPSTVVFVLTALVFGARVFAAAQPPDIAEPDSHANKQSSRPPLKLAVKADKSVYAPGDTVTFTIELKNPTKQPVPLRFATGKKYDVLIGKLGPGKKWPAEGVWRWSMGMMFAQMVTTTTYAPGQTVTYQIKYPPDDGTKPPPLTAGEYCVKANITTMGTGPKLEATMMFKVKMPKSR